MLMKSKSSFIPDFLNNYRELGCLDSLEVLVELIFVLIS